MPIIAIIIAFVGYLIGTKAPLAWQLVFVVGCLFYLKYQRTFREIGRVFPLIGFWIAMIGMAIGNIVFAIVHPDQVAVSEITKGLGWLLTP